MYSSKLLVVMNIEFELSWLGLVELNETDDMSVIIVSESLTQKSSYETPQGGVLFLHDV